MPTETQPNRSNRVRVASKRDLFCAYGIERIEDGEAGGLG